MATPKRPTKKRPLTPESPVSPASAFEPRGKRARGGLFGFDEDEAPMAAAATPSVAVHASNLRTVDKAYALRSTRLPYSNTELVQVDFPENYESFAAAFNNAKMREMNAVYPLYDSLEAFKAAPAPAVYVYGFFDDDRFGALQVQSYAEFLTRHTAVARRMGATKVFAAGEIFKHGPTVVEYNVTSGTFSKELTDRGVRDTASLMDYVRTRLVAAGFTATPARGAAATPGTFITENALPVRNAELNLFRRFGLTATKVTKTRRHRHSKSITKSRRSVASA